MINVKNRYPLQLVAGASISGSKVRLVHGSINSGSSEQQAAIHVSCYPFTALFVHAARVAELADAPDLGSGG